MDWGIFGTMAGTVIAILIGIYTFLRNFKADINSHIDRLEKRMDKFEDRITSLEERIFWMATGKKLEDAILEQKMKNEKKK